MDSEYAFQFRKIRFSTDILSEVIRIGVPAGIQSLVITLSNVMVQYHINSISEDAIAAFTAYFKVELIIYLPIVAMGQAAMAFAGQCKGADDREGIRKGTKICLLLSIIMTIVISVLALLCGAALPCFYKRKGSDRTWMQDHPHIIPVLFPLLYSSDSGRQFAGMRRGSLPDADCADEHMSASNGDSCF